MTLRAKIFILLTAFVFLAGQWGCATRPQITPPQFPPTFRSQLGTIGVISKSPNKKPHWQKPAEGWAAGLGQGASKGLQLTAGNGFTFFIAGSPYGLWVPGGIAIALGLALAPPAALVGSLYGAIAAESPEEIERAEAQLQRAWEIHRLPLNLQSAMVKVAREKAHRMLMTLNCQISQNPQEQKVCKDLGMDVIDTVLELNMTNLALGGESGVNPSLHLSLVLHAKVIRTADRSVLDDLVFNYSGTDQHTFLKWADNDAQLLKEEFMVGYETLAQQVVDYLFLPSPLPSPPPDVIDNELAW